MHPRIAHELVASDGTQLRYYLHGRTESTDEVVPLVVLSNGLATPEEFWAFIIQKLGHECLIVHWDYRGHGQSASPTNHDFRSETLADDLARLTDAVRAKYRNVGPVVQLGFSMGVVVVLELFRRRPELVSAMILVAGPADTPFILSWPFRISAVFQVTKAVIDAMTPVAAAVRPLLRFLLDQEGLPYRVGVAMKIIEPHTPAEQVGNFVRAFRAMDFVDFWRGARALLRARGSDLLPSIRHPVLLIEGGRDTFVLEPQREQLRRGIPHAQCVHFAKGTHAVLVEEGPGVAQAVHSFVQRVAESLRKSETSDKRTAS